MEPNLFCNILVVTGMPGSGKTLLVEGILSEKEEELENVFDYDRHY